MKYAMEREMCEAMARYTPFSSDDIFTTWLSFKSFDLILRAVEFARVLGIVSINEAVNHLVADYVAETKRGRNDKK